MATQHEKTRFTADAFIAWALEQPRERYELVAGEIVAMSPERVSHAETKAEIWLALRKAIAGAGLSCIAYIDGVSVRIDDRTVYEPDVLVRCGDRTPGEATWIDDPIILVEVVSPSSRAIDSGAKLTEYFRLASLRHYLVVNIDARAVTHHRRDEAGEISTRIFREGSLRLDPPGLALETGDVFAAL